MEGLRPNLPLILEAINNILVAPADFVREALRLDKNIVDFRVIISSPSLYSTSALVSIGGPAKLLVLPFASSYHKGEGRLRKASGVQGRPYRGSSCGAPSL